MFVIVPTIYCTEHYLSELCEYAQEDGMRFVCRECNREIFIPWKQMGVACVNPVTKRKPDLEESFVHTRPDPTGEPPTERVRYERRFANRRAADR